MRPLLLAVNAGSSSLKLAAYRVKDDSNDPVSLLATASFSNINSPDTQFKYSLTDTNFSSRNSKVNVQDHKTAFAHFLEVLFADEHFTAQGYSRQNITHICHRVVHGGQFTEPVIVRKNTYDHISSLSDLAPLHNNSALNIIMTCHDALPDALSVAFFDSAFHTTLQPHIYTYAISPSVAREKNLRKYGFHGLSYSFVLRSVSNFLNKPTLQTSLIALHLGSGASICAIRNGRSVNTTMGLTPLSGLPGSTRSGDVDSSLIFHYAAQGEDVGRMSVDRTRQMHVTEAEKILNTEAGWKALTGTPDFHEIATSSAPSHKLAFDILVDRISQFVGGYFVQLQGHIDALVFSGGLGENSSELRKAVVQQCACLGIDSISDEKNEGHHANGDVVFDIGQGTVPSRSVRVLVCKTNEELEIARECALRKEFWKKD